MLYSQPQTNMNDLSFVIPVRIDTFQRLENLIACVEFLRKQYESPILVLEADSYRSAILPTLLEKKALYHFREDRDTIFHRTKYINDLVGMVDTPFVAVWDCDVIISYDQITQASRTLKDGHFSFAFPYEKDFLDTGYLLREVFFKTGEIETLHAHKGKMTRLYEPDPIGGAFLANIKDYGKTGLENPAFYGWGREDGERLQRWRSMGFQHSRITGPLFHLTHPRGLNSTFHATKEDEGKWQDIQYIKSLGQKELTQEIRKWAAF